MFCECVAEYRRTLDKGHKGVILHGLSAISTTVKYQVGLRASLLESD